MLKINKNLPQAYQVITVLNPTLYFVKLAPTQVELIKFIIVWAIFGILCIFILRNLFFAEFQRESLMKSETRFLSMVGNFVVIEILSIPLISLLTTTSCNEANYHKVHTSLHKGYQAVCKSTRFASFSTNYTGLFQVTMLILIILFLKRLNFDYRLKGQLFGVK